MAFLLLHNYTDFILSVASVVMVTNIIADHLATFLLTTLFNINVLETIDKNILFYSLLSFLLAVGIMIFYSKLYSENTAYLTSENGKRLFALSTTSVLIIFYLNVFLEIISGNQKNLVELNLLFFSVIIVVAIIAIGSYIQSIRKNYEIEQQKLEFEMMHTYTDELEQQYVEIKKFRHDYQNILTSLEGFIVKKDYLGLDEYFFTNIKPTSQQIQQNEFVMKDLANMKLIDVKSLLANKVVFAQEKILM